MTDKIAKDRSRLNFTRVIIEIEIGVEVLSEVQFVNEYEQLVN